MGCSSSMGKGRRGGRVWVGRLVVLVVLGLSWGARPRGAVGGEPPETSIDVPAAPPAAPEPVMSPTAPAVMSPTPPAVLSPTAPAVTAPLPAPMLVPVTTTSVGSPAAPGVAPQVTADREP